MNVIEIENAKDIDLSALLKKFDKNKEEMLLKYGKSHKKIAVLVPYSQYKKEKSSIILGLLKGKAGVKISRDFKLCDRDFLKA